jgi:hypothetical protein
MNSLRQNDSVDVIFVNDYCFYLNIKLHFKNLVATKPSLYHPRSREKSQIK